MHDYCRYSMSHVFKKAHSASARRMDTHPEVVARVEVVYSLWSLARSGNSRRLESIDFHGIRMATEIFEQKRARSCDRPMRSDRCHPEIGGNGPRCC